MSGFLAVGYFLFTLVFSLLVFVLWIRIALRYFRVSSLHPVGRGIKQLTDPIVQPIDRLLPSKKGLSTRYDWAAFIVLCVIELIKFIVINLIFVGGLLPLWLILAYTLADLIVQPCNLLFYAIIIQVIMSWVNPGWHHPAADVLRLITEPSLRFARRYVPDIAGLDLSPVVILVILQMVTLFINASLPGHLL